MLADYDKIQAFFESRSAPPAVKLFRAKTAPLILFFLKREFKDKPVGYIKNSDLVRWLVEVLEHIHFTDYIEEDDDALQKVLDSTEKAELLIRNWSDRGYITFEPDEKGNYQHSLTSETEKVLGWLESLQKENFISAESKFIDIFNKLREITENSTENWKEKLETLKEKRRDLDAEIRQLEIEQKVVSAEDYFVQSRFNEVNKLARSLMADFREVEENFTSIKNTIYEKQTNLELSKGNILNYTLDALDEIRNTHQGKSFEAFYRHLLDDSSKDELTDLIKKVITILGSRGIEVEDLFLLRLRIYLNQEGSRVRNSYHKLAEKLNKVLAEKSMLERKTAILLINDIKSMALQAKDNPPKEDSFIAIDGLAHIDLSIERPLTEEVQDNFVKLKALKNADIDLTDMDLGNLVGHFYIDKGLLEKNIMELLKNKTQVTLKEIVEHHPVTQGLSEVLTYINIATQSPGSFINREKQELIILNEPNTKAIRLPEIIYTK